MATTDRRGVSVSATDAPVTGDPNPGLAIKAPAVCATTGTNIPLSGVQTIDGVTVGNNGERVLVKDQTDATTNGLYNASTGNWTRTTDANSSDKWTQGTQILVSQGVTLAYTTFQLTTANPIVLGTSSLNFIRIGGPTTISTVAPLAGGGSLSTNPSISLGINTSLQVIAGNLAVATLAGVSHQWVSSINSSGIPQLTQPAFSDLSGTASSAQVPALPTGVTLAGSILATNIVAPGTPASGKTSIYVDSTQKVLSAINDAGTVSNTVVPSSGTSGQFVTGISAAGVLSYGGINTSLQVIAGNLAVATLAGVSHQWVSSINSSGIPQLTQPAFSDLSGTAAATQVPINASLQVTGGNLAVATLAGVSHQWVSSINSSGIPQLTQPAFSDLSGTASTAQVPALASGVTLAGSILATNIVAPSTPASGKTSIYVDSTQKVLSAINDAGTVSSTVVPSSGAAGQFVTGISAAGVLSYGTPGGSGTVNSSPAGEIAYYPAASASVSGNASLSISGGALTLLNAAIGASSSDGFILTNTTPAGAGAQQFSPRLHLIGQGWKTTATAASQTVDWIIENQPVQGASNPTTNLVLSSQVNGAGYTVQVTLTSGGVLNVATGFQVGGSAASANVLRGNGTNFVSAALAAADLSNGATGSGAVVLATSATLVTPTLGAATATSINKVAFTQPASAATLTIANNKTLTVSNTLTFTGTDATSFAFPGASDTVAALNTAQTFTAQNIFAPASTIASSTGAALDDVKVAATTTTITGNTGSPITRLAKVGIYQPTLTDASAVTVTDAATLYIDNAPTAAGSVTITHAWSILVGAGNVKFAGTANAVGTITSGVWNGTAITPQYGGTGAATLTAHAVLLGNGTGTFNVATIGTSGRLLIDQGAGADPSFNAMSGDATVTNAGAITVAKVNGVSYGTSPGTNTVPVVTGTNAVTYEAVPNAALANSSLTIGSTSISLGATASTLAGVTSYNKVAITAPATGSTLTIADGKTLTVNNTLTLAGTDGTTMTFPGASDTVAGLGTAQTWTKQNVYNIATTIASSTGAALDDVKIAAATTTITGNTGSPITRLAKVGLYQPTLTDSSAVTVTDAATLYIDNAPTAGGSVTITNAWSLLVGAGNVKFAGTGNAVGTITSGVWNGTALAAPYISTGAMDPNALVGLQLNASVGSNLLTIALKNNAGNDPTSAAPVVIAFRDVTVANGDPTYVTISSALSISTNATGATLGTVNSVPFRLWVLLFNNGSTPVLALFQSVTGGATPTAIAGLVENTLQSTTGISGSATAAGTFYTPNGTSLTSKAFRILGFVDYASGLATAGTYGSAPTTIQLFGPGIRKPGEVVQTKLAILTSATATSSASYGNTTTALSITPSSAPNLVEFLAAGNLQNNVAGNGGITVMFRGTVSGTQVGYNTFAASVAGGSTPLCMPGLDAPGTASSQTYTVGLRAQTVGDGVTFGTGVDANFSTIILKEIMA